MPARLSPIGWIAKYLVVPVALGGLGYYVIGPRIGAVKQPPKLDAVLGNDSTAPAQAPVTTKPAGPQKQPPTDVEVSSQPADSSGQNLGQDSDQASTDGAGQDVTPKPRVRHKGGSPSMEAPPTDPNPDGGSDSGG